MSVAVHTLNDRICPPSCFFFRVNCHTCHIWKIVAFQALEIPFFQIWQVKLLKYHYLPNTARFNQSAFRNFPACIIIGIKEVITDGKSFFCRKSLNLKYFYLAFFIYACFTINMTFLVLCLNSWSIDSLQNSTSTFSQVGRFSQSSSF